MPRATPKIPGKNDHCTPASIYDRIGPIALDPCSNEWSTVPARKKFFSDDDGLTKSWKVSPRHGCVFVNPPYSSILPWVDKAIREATMHPSILIAMLLPSDNSATWWQRAMAGSRCAIALKQRVKFVAGHGGRTIDAGRGHWIFLMGDVPQPALIAVLGLGVVVWPAS